MNAGNGIDVTAGDVDIADNLNVTTDATITGNTRVDGTFQFDAAGQTVDNIVTSIGATGLDTNIPTEQAVREAIDNTVNADNGLNESPSGTINLGGDLNEATLINTFGAGNTLTIQTDGGDDFIVDGTNGDLIVDQTGNTSLTGTATLTTGTGQVTLGGNVDATGGLDVTGGSGLDVGGSSFTVDNSGNVSAGGTLGVTGATTLNDALTVVDGATATNINNNTINLGNAVTDNITATGNVTIADGASTTAINANTINLGNVGTDVITVAGDLNAGNGIDVTAGDVDIADNLNVTTDATITGNTRVDGTFQFDAAGQTVDNIVTSIGATGLDTNIPTEQAVREAIDNTVNADNGLNESPSGTINLGGDLNEATLINTFGAGNTLTIQTDGGDDFIVDGTNGDLIVDQTGNTSLTGTATLTTGTGQVTLGGNVDATGGLDVTGGSGLDVGGSSFTVDNSGNVSAGGTLGVTGATTLNDALTVVDGATATNINNNTINLGNAVTDNITATGNVTIADGASTTAINANTINLGNVGTDVITVAGDLNAGNGIDVTAGDVDIADNLNVTTDATITGNTRVDGTFQFDAAGQTVDNIVTSIGAMGLDTNIPTEQAVREAIDNTVNADNGLNESPSGTINLGGDLNEATLINTFGAGNTLTIQTDGGDDFIVDGTNGDLIVDQTGNTSLTGTATLTTGTGQVTLGGNVDATGGLDVTGGSGLDVGGSSFTVDNSGNVSAGGTLGVTGATTLNDALTVVDGATATNINNNTINLGNAGTDAIGIVGTATFNEDIIFNEATNDLTLAVLDQTAALGVLQVPDLAGATETIATDADITSNNANLVLRDGSQALTNNWDAGSFNIRAETLSSDVATGTAPLTVASTTAVANLNADLLDGQHAPSGTIVGTSDAQTLSNKTLSSNTVATTQTAGNNTTAVATTAFVTDAVTTSNTLNSAEIFVGNVSNVATGVAMSGDASIDNTGALTVNSVGGSSAANINSAEIAANAATNLNTASTIVARGCEWRF